ncbi:site-specific DNA-methyltransferase [Clostridium perfringens]|uniref:DNA-methyltransferase n=1 Tax=Clostridium perfringens TaxID=1502 RepID=UPI0033905ADB|nr:site-specific DNA-methyltransferase [Clostridium perfringens]
MELNKIYNQDCIEYMKTLPNECVDLIIADPPYYKAINEKWDKQWKTEEEYLNWTQQWFNECVRILKPTGVFYCYGNFDILSKQKVLIFDKQLNFRQNITLSKGLRAIAGRTSDKLRMFPTASEYLLYYVKQDEFFDTPFSRIMKNKMKELNLNQSDIARLELSKNGKVTGWVHNKLKGIQIPTEQQWGKISKLFNIKNNYNDLVKQYNKERYIFNLPIGITDVWEFKPDKARYGHKTQKPEDITDRIIKASSNEGQLVYIPFAGSGSEMVSCIKNNRNYIATETNKKYIDEIINKRIENTHKELNEMVG